MSWSLSSSGTRYLFVRSSSGSSVLYSLIFSSSWFPCSSWYVLPTRFGVSVTRCPHCLHQQVTFPFLSSIQWRSKQGPGVSNLSSPHMYLCLGSFFLFCLAGQLFFFLIALTCRCLKCPSGVTSKTCSFAMVFPVLGLRVKNEAHISLMPAQQNVMPTYQLPLKRWAFRPYFVQFL